MQHPLHHKIAEAFKQEFSNDYIVLTDVDCACGDERHRLPLFIGSNARSEAPMCCVDILIVSSHGIKVVVEIDESDLKPTQICGKFLTSALATQFVHQPSGNGPYPMCKETLFVQVLDSSKWKNGKTRKDLQASEIESRINGMLPLKISGISKYMLFSVNGDEPDIGAAKVIKNVSEYLVGACQ